MREFLKKKLTETNEKDGNALRQSIITDDDLDSDKDN